MDRILKIILAITALFFLVLVARLYELSIAESDKLKQSSFNKRNLIASLNAPRGKILASDGTVIAESRGSQKKKRYYPFGRKMAHLTGYYSQRYGASEAELVFNRILSVDYADLFWNTAPPEPENVRLSIDKNLQLKAYSLLRHKGAMAAVEVKTGKIICLVSYPSFDPNTIDADFEKIRKDPDAPLLNRVCAGVYPPGSTIKILTLGAYLEEGGDITDAFRAPAVYRVGGFRITNYSNRDFGTITLVDAFKYSVNTVFAQLGLWLGPEKMKSYMLKSGFGKKTGIELEDKAGHLPENLNDPVTLAWASVGQADLSVTPLQILMVVQAVANDGLLLQPTILADTAPEPEARIFSVKTAEKLQEAMRKVVTEGTGKKANSITVKTAGKTGTAEVEGKKPHAWFAGFAPYEDPEIAVVVILENAGTGGEKAAPIFRELIDYYFSR